MKIKYANGIKLVTKNVYAYNRTKGTREVVDVIFFSAPGTKDTPLYVKAFKQSDEDISWQDRLQALSSSENLK